MYENSSLPLCHKTTQLLVMTHMGNEGHQDKNNGWIQQEKLLLVSFTTQRAVSTSLNKILQAWIYLSIGRPYLYLLHNIVTHFLSHAVSDGKRKVLLQ